MYRLNVQVTNQIVPADMDMVRSRELERLNLRSSNFVHR